MIERRELEPMYGKQVICMADQGCFNAGGNEFGVLFPIVFRDGTPVTRHETVFPNRGRLWWMVDFHIDARAVRPGQLFTARIEPAVEREDRPDKDYFQADKREVQVGPEGFFEVLDVPKLPTARELMRGWRLGCDHPPAGSVVLSSERGILGPLSAEWDGEAEEARFAPLDPAEAICFRGGRGLLDEFGYQTYEHFVNTYDPRHPDRAIRVGLVKEPLGARLRDTGERVFIGSDQQVVSWGVKRMELSRRQGQGMREFLDRAEALKLADEGIGDQLERFREICADGKAVLDLGEEVAEILNQSSESFRGLIERHVATLAEDRVEEEVARRSREIEQSCAESLKRRERLSKDIEELERDYEAKALELEQAFKFDNEERFRALEEREGRVEEREHQVANQETEVAARLQKLIDRYESGVEEVVEEVLLTAPVLARMGWGGSSGESAPRPARGRLTLPGFLESERTKGGLPEPEFIQQFQDVVRHRGFVFDHDDLVNFHLSVKVGTWTVLAGPSGTGKSSLPRLYAEALGVLPEFLSLAVRPDWLDDRDLFGAFNALAGRFEPAPSGLIDRLIAAHEDARRDRGGLYLVCLDEMNLARVEHYFSQLLSILERPAGSRQLELFARGLLASDDPYGPYRTLPIHENLRFVGTVNVDETTHFFSPKVLDRASIVLLEDVDGGEVTVTRHADSIGGLAPVHEAEFAGWVRTGAEVEEGELDHLRAIEELLRRHRFTLGHRSRRRLRAYLASARGLLTQDRALDLAVAQMVLPRLRAMSPEYPRLLEGLRELLPAERYRRSARILEALLESGARYDFFQIV